MKYTKIPNTDLEVSSIALGTWAMGNDFWGTVDDNESIRAIEASIDSGVNFIDTAPAYGAGHAETVVAKAIEGKRDKVIVATKAGVIRTETEYLRDLSPKNIKKDIEESLKRLKTDCIDLYYIHWPDVNTPLEESINALLKHKQQGKFRYLAVSNFSIELIEQAQQMTDIVCLQPNYSMLNRKIENDIMPFCEKKLMGIISYGTLAGGLLTGKFRELPKFEKGDNRGRFYDYYREDIWSSIQGLLSLLDGIAEKHSSTVAQIAIAWTIQQKGVTSVLVGAKNEKQAIANAGAANVLLSTDDCLAIYAYLKNHLQEVIY
ncbi:aldo/keto reductase [Aurantibacter crassamenti]|uniref:aldo/keto reductase n=1 Tax=Aurantibacter crassamenti TaxID=1837375 RepID=UPI00193AA2BE|nr:aldo/keto reductase [Aurantibacter crassamenti]MBM1106469.1 aldo/keto reductase [Aurantibacter crassamenti]